MADTSGALRAPALGVIALLLAGCAAADRSTSAEADPISLVIADFANTTGDPAFEPALKHALAFALAASPRLHVFEGPQVADSLRAMNYSADARVTADLAWEIAVREEIDLLVLGSIEPAGDGLVIVLEAVAAQGGRTRARTRWGAAGRDETIDVLGHAALDLQHMLGGPGAPTGVPLSERLTGSLDALAHYAAGRQHADKGRHAHAEPHYCDALAIDPHFDAAREALRTPAACDEVADAPVW